MIIRREFDLDVLRSVGKMILRDLREVDGVSRLKAELLPYDAKFHCETLLLSDPENKVLFLEQSNDGSVPLRLGVYLNDAVGLSRDMKRFTEDLLVSQSQSLSRAGFRLTNSNSIRDYQSFSWDRKGISDWLVNAPASVGRDIVWLYNLDQGGCDVAEILLRVRVLLPVWLRLNGVDLPKKLVSDSIEIVQASDLKVARQQVPIVTEVFESVAPVERLEDLQISGLTEVERLVKQRVLQDRFREELIGYWEGRCSVTGLAVEQLLRASHIKPWAKCESDKERLDVFNGLLLAPNLDAAFDRGYITFSDGGVLCVSPQLKAASALLGLDGDLKVRRPLDKRHKHYLAWHRANCFRAA